MSGENVTPIDKNKAAIQRHANGDDYLPQIPEGEYRVAFDYYETTYRFGKNAKLILHFHIADKGEYFELPVSRWYSVKNIGTEPGRNGNFKVLGQTSILLIEYLNCFPSAGRPARLDRVPMDLWPRHQYLARVTNVRNNHKQQDLPHGLQYSRIESLIGVAKSND